MNLKKARLFLSPQTDPLITPSYDISLLLLHKKGTGTFKKVNIQGLSPTFGVEIARKI